MTEDEWFASAEPWSLVRAWWRPTPDGVHPAGDRRLRSERLLRLFAVACARRVADLCPDPRFGEAVAAAERHADVQTNAARQRLKTERAALITPRWAETPVGQLAAVTMTRSGWQSAGSGRSYAHRLAATAGWDGSAEQAWQAGLFRDLIGNPFRPARFSGNWRTATTLALARTMYEGRDFAAISVLADALQDAGCEDPAVLGHCRDPDGVHVRGCWVVDLVLGRA